MKNSLYFFAIFYSCICYGQKSVSDYLNDTSYIFDYDTIEDDFYYECSMTMPDITLSTNKLLRAFSKDSLVYKNGTFLNSFMLGKFVLNRLNIDTVSLKHLFNTYGRACMKQKKEKYFERKFARATFYKLHIKLEYVKLGDVERSIPSLTRISDVNADKYIPDKVVKTPIYLITKILSIKEGFKNKKCK
jgi:hypothetical protein